MSIKLLRSIKAHDRLAWKHSRRGGLNGEIKATYHKQISAIQRHQKRVLPLAERRLQYDSIESALTKRRRSCVSREDFSRDSRGRIKGSWVNGRFEPV